MFHTIVIHFDHSHTQGSSVPAGPSPPNYLDKQLALHLPVFFDATPSGKKFGDVAVDVKSSYKIVSGSC